MHTIYIDLHHISSAYITYVLYVLFIIVCIYHTVCVINFAGCIFRGCWLLAILAIYIRGWPCFAIAQEPDQILAGVNFHGWLPICKYREYLSPEKVKVHTVHTAYTVHYLYIQYHMHSIHIYIM